MLKDGLNIQRNRSLLINTLSGYVSKIFSVVANLLYIRWTIDYLSGLEFGLWMTLMVLNQYIRQADLGIGVGLLNTIALSKERRKDNEIVQVVNSVFFVSLVQSAILLLVLFVLYFFELLPKLLSISEQFVPIIMTFLTLNIIGLAGNIVHTIFRAFQEVYISHIFQTLISASGLMLIYLGVKSDLGVDFVILSHAKAYLFWSIVVISYAFCIRYNFLRLNINSFSFKKIQHVVRQGLGLFILSIFTLVILRADNILISNKLGYEEVKDFALVEKLGLLSFITSSLISSLWPAFREARDSGDKEWLSKVFKRTAIAAGLVAFLIGVIVSLYGNYILSFVVGKSVDISPIRYYAVSSWLIVTVFVGLYSAILNSYGYIKFQVLCLGLTLLISLVSKVCLINTGNEDYLVFGTSLPYLLFFIIPCTKKIKEII